MQHTPNQLLAINTLDRNLQIIACAGSGKTQVIAQRVINLLQNNREILPANITAFTYTEKAAAELKARVLRLCREQLGNVLGLAEMYVGTIHGWCLNVLQQHIYEYQKFSVLDEVKQKLFVDRNFSRIGMKDLDMERFKDTGHFIALMGILRESELTDESKVPEKIRVSLQNYEDTFKRGAYFDFTAIMKRALAHLQTDSRFRQTICGQLKYLVVDEYQDVNPIQEAIVKEIYELGANVCVVGDDDQTIFQWRGSDVRYIQKFRTRYENVEYIKLEDNFRSTTGVVDIALKTISNNKLRLQKQMKASGDQVFERGDCLINFFDTVKDENEHIVQTIQNLRGAQFTEKEQSRGLDYSDFVILLRKWKKADAIVAALQAADIPFIVTGVNQLFDREEVRAAVAIFQYQKGDLDSSVIDSYWRGIVPTIEADKLDEALSYLDEKNPSNFDFYESYSLQDVFLGFLRKLGITEEVFADGSGNTTQHTAEEIVFYNLGMFSQVIDDFETINFVSKPENKLRGFLDFIRYAADDYYPEGWLSNSYQIPNAVQIMTIFQAKGLEFPVVFLPGMNRNYLPAAKIGGRSVWHFLDKSLIKDQIRYEGGVEDERRLLYVAVTRSQKFLFVSRAPEEKGYEKKESEFCKELQRSDFIFSSKSRNFSDRTKARPQPRIAKTDILLNFSILKNFFECGYRFKLLTLYGFRQPLSARLGFGKSIHDCLMEVHKEVLDGGSMDRSHIPRLLDAHLHLPYAVESVREDMKTRASEALDEYFELNEKAFQDILFAEKNIQLDLGEGILVNGRMDLIKRKQLDGTYITTIVDFKSASDAQTYDVSMEQLSLYALGYKDLSGEQADFLEIYNLDENRPHRQELLDADLDQVKLRIIEAADAIRSNRLERTCQTSSCKACWLNTICSGVIQIQA